MLGFAGAFEQHSVVGKPPALELGSKSYRNGNRAPRFRRDTPPLETKGHHAVGAGLELEASTRIIWR
jgi:hypothetical protein